MENRFICSYCDVIAICIEDGTTKCRYHTNRRLKRVFEESHERHMKKLKEL